MHRFFFVQNHKMPPEISLIKSVLKMHCPRCRKGKLFYTTIFEFKRITDMPKNCSVCNQKFMPEPGFYYGAMFISYIMTAFIFLGFIAICMFGFGLDVNTSFILLAVLIAIGFIWFFRISRSIWIHINVPYENLEQ